MQLAPGGDERGLHHLRKLSGGGSAGAQVRGDLTVKDLFFVNWCGQYGGTVLSAAA